MIIELNIIWLLLVYVAIGFLLVKGGCKSFKTKPSVKKYLLSSLLWGVVFIFLLFMLAFKNECFYNRVEEIRRKRAEKDNMEKDINKEKINVEQK